MALINCPECGKEVSDKAEKCIHCGYPLIGSNTKCIINGKQYELAFMLNNANKIEIIKKLRMSTGLDLGEAKELTDTVFLTQEIPKIYSFSQPAPQPQQNLPKCPRCKSTAITAGQRGYNLMWGFLGSNKTVNRCANCGHTWKP